MILFNIQLGINYCVNYLHLQQYTNMKKLILIITFLLVLISSLSYGQERQGSSKIILTGNIIESNNKKQLE